MQALLEDAEFVEWRCCECGKGFADENLLKKHIPENHKASWKCNDCDQVLKSYRDLINHSVEEHNLHGCPDCGKVLKTAQALKSHIADKHKHMDQYICTDCQVGFRHKHSHASHIAEQHNSWKCSVCAKIFKAGNSLQSHFNSKHRDNITEERKRGEEGKVDGKDIELEIEIKIEIKEEPSEEDLLNLTDLKTEAIYNNAGEEQSAASTLEECCASSQVKSPVNYEFKREEIDVDYDIKVENPDSFQSHTDYDIKVEEQEEVLLEDGDGDISLKDNVKEKEPTTKSGKLSMILPAELNNVSNTEFKQFFESAYGKVVAMYRNNIPIGPLKKRKKKMWRTKVWVIFEDATVSMMIYDQRFVMFRGIKVVLEEVKQQETTSTTFELLMQSREVKKDQNEEDDDKISISSVEAECNNCFNCKQLKNSSQGKALTKNAKRKIYEACSIPAVSKKSRKDLLSPNTNPMPPNTNNPSMYGWGPHTDYQSKQYGWLTPGYDMNSMGRIPHYVDFS